MYHRDILVEQTDPELFAAIQAENKRQEEHIELIASENYASPAVMAAHQTRREVIARRLAEVLITTGSARPSNRLRLIITIVMIPAATRASLRRKMS